MFRPSQDGQKIKAPTSIVVLHKSGEVEINCPKCKQGVYLPLVAAEGVPTLRKARSQRFIVRKKKPPEP